MNEFSFGVVKDVVIAEETIAAQVVCYFVALFHQWLLIEVISNTDSATYYKIHL